MSRNTSNNAALRVTKNTGALFLSKASVMAFSFVFVIYVARFLGVDGFGKYALLRGYFELFLSLGATGLCIVITREIARNPSQASRYLTSSFFLVSILVTIISGLLIGLVHVLPYSPDTQVAAYIVCLALFPAAINQLFEAVFIAFERAEFVTYGTLTENVVRTGLSILALFMGYGLLAIFVILFATRIGLLLLYAVLLSRQAITLQWNFDRAFLKQLFHDWRVFALENWLSNLFWNLDIIILSVLHGEFAVGLYAAAAKIMGLFSTVADSYTMAIFPYLSKLFAESKGRFRGLSELSIKYMLVLVLPGIIVLAILADEVILRLYTAEYAEAIPILQVLVWVVLIRFLGPFLSHILFARGEQKKSLWVAAISLPIYVILAFSFAPRWGGVGAAWALLLSTSVALCLYLFFVFRQEGAIRLVNVSFRTVVAATGFGVFLLALRQMQLVPLLGLGGLFYLLLLLLLRVPSSNELGALRKVASSGLRQLQAVLR